MDALHHRRVNVASYWALSRISVLDSFESYEDSYAIAEEFREWIACIGENPEFLEDLVQIVPKSLPREILEETNDSDEVVEL